MSPNDSTSQGSLILETIRTRHPATVRQLAGILAEGDPTFDELGYLESVKSMMKNGSLTLGPPSYEITSVLDYLLTVTVSGWVWLVYILACTGVIMVYMIPAQYPMSVFRWIFGSILICLPGHSTIKFLFPHSRLPWFEQLGLSIAVSLAIIPIIGFVLNFTPWGIRFLPVVISLGTYSVLIVTAAAWRDFLELAQIPE